MPILYMVYDAKRLSISDNAVRKYLRNKVKDLKKLPLEAIFEEN